MNKPRRLFKYSESEHVRCTVKLEIVVALKEGHQVGGEVEAGLKLGILHAKNGDNGACSAIGLCAKRSLTKKLHQQTTNVPR
jgi:hypothetical protein